MSRLTWVHRFTLWLFEKTWKGLLLESSFQQLVLNRLCRLPDKNGNQVYHSVDQMVACGDPKFFQDHWAGKEGIERCAVYQSVKVLDQLIGGSWIVFELSQSPAHFLWCCQIIDFDSMLEVEGSERKERHVFVEEYDTAIDAVRAATKKAIDQYSQEKNVEYSITAAATEQHGS